MIRRVEKRIDELLSKSSAHIDGLTTKLLDKLEQKDTKLLNTETTSEVIAENYYETILDLVEMYYDLVDPYTDFARKTTIPFNWPYYLYLKMKNHLMGNILFKDGVHFFVALQGGGKSTLAYDLISEILRKTGKSSYVNAQFEKPQYDPITQKYFVYFQYFELLDFFDMSVKEDDPSIKVSQKKRFNRNFDTIVLDEWLTEMNHRMNKTKDYNNIFMALLNMIAHMRHQKMKRIYVLSQIDNTDIQLLSMFKYIHELEIDLDVTYRDWIETGMMTRHIKGWTIWTYGVKRNRKKQSMDKVLIKKQYRKATADFTYFDTLSQAEKYAVLHEDKINFIRE